MVRRAGALVVVLTFVSWPGAAARAFIPAHGAPLGEITNAPASAIEAPEGDARVDHFVAVMVNTGERATITLRGASARPDADSFAALRHLCRAFPSNKEGPLDLALVETLHQIAQATGGTIEIVSGYRAPKNRFDRNYHVRGQAADVRVPGVPTYKLVRLVKKLGVKGVGNYPSSAFVHVDVRDEPYAWTDWSGPGR